jgi:thiol-disulfide isomerase/thioredoxin
MKTNKISSAIAAIALCLLPAMQTAHAGGHLPPLLIGNWIATPSNNWEYGFSEEFAIYNCAFWDYSVIQEKGKTTKITLQKEGKTLSLEIDQKNDTLITIKNGKSKKQEYALMRKRYPDYKTSDSAPFPTPAFRRDSATIIGYYRDFDKISEFLDGLPDDAKDMLMKIYLAPFEVAVNDFIKSEQIDYQTPIDSLGRFSITFPIINTQLVYVDWKRLTKTMVFSPNDTLFLFADFFDLLPHPEDKGWDGLRLRNKQILCMGNNARVNNELLQYDAPRIFVDREEEIKKGISDMEYLRICEDVYNQRVAHLEKHIAACPSVSEKFRFLRTTEEKYNLAFDLMQHRFDLRDKNGYLPFQEGYMDYVNKNFSFDNPAIYTLVREYHTFINDYIGYYSGSKKVSHPLNLLLEEAGLNTPENIRLINDYDDIVEKIMAEKDTAKQGQLVEANKELIDKGDELHSNPLIKEAEGNYVRRIFMDMDYHKVDSLLHEPALKSLYATYLYCSDFDVRHIPWPDKDLPVMKSRVTNPFLLDMLLEINDNYLKLSRGKMEHEESLKNTAYLTDINDADAIFKKITEPYKDKVIFIDFWGTWCRPCIKNIQKYAHVMEEKFKGKDVIFMYLANSSPENTWKNLIKQLEITGEQIVHYRLPDRQQYLLEQKLNVQNFPTYFIIDRAGNISDFNIHISANFEETMAELEKELGKELEKK